MKYTGRLEAAREAARLASHLGVVLAVVNLRDKLRHLLHAPVSQAEDLWCRWPRPGAGRPLLFSARPAGPLTLLSLLSLQLLVCQIQRIFLRSLQPLTGWWTRAGVDGARLGITGLGGLAG